MKNEIFKYHENPITFQNGENIMVNATQMAKSFGKLPAEFLRLLSTVTFRAALSNMGKSLNIESQIVTRRGGPLAKEPAGTWFIDDLAMEYARWLSPEFAIWTNDQIKTLLQQGYVTAKNITRTQLANMILEAEKEIEVKNAQLAIANTRIEKDAPRVNYVSEFFDAKGSMSVGEMAKTFSIKPNRMFQMLRDDGYLIKRKGTDWNIPKQQYMDAGYFTLKVTVKNNVEYTQTRVTPRGHGYFAKKYNLFSLEIVNPI